MSNIVLIVSLILLSIGVIIGVFIYYGSVVGVLTLVGIIIFLLFALLKRENDKLKKVEL